MVSPFPEAILDKAPVEMFSNMEIPLAIPEGFVVMTASFSFGQSRSHPLKAEEYNLTGFIPSKFDNIKFPPFVSGNK